MSGISNISKSIRKSNCRVNLSRAVSQILKANNEHFHELMVNNLKEREKCGSVTRPQTQNVVPNRTEELRMWVLTHNVARRAVNDLLKILKSIGLNWLSADSRTLCKTPRSTDVFTMAGGQYWYNGIRKNIQLLFANTQSNLSLKLNVNVDGIPLMSSSSTQFWPILANVHSKLWND